MWIGDPEKRNVLHPDHAKLVAQREALIKEIKTLRGTPMPRNGDVQQNERFRQRQLTDLATQIVKINKKLGQ